MGANVLLFGSGYMGTEYSKVLKALSRDAIIVGRDAAKAKTLADKFGFASFGGGIDALDWIDCAAVDLAIIAVSIEALKDVTAACLRKGIKHVLVEKPGGLGRKDLEAIKAVMQDGADVRIAHNRRFYNSVRLLKKKIDEDGGATGCFFDFTERENDLHHPSISDAAAKRWGFTNSTHVIDTAFFLIGEPKELVPIHAGKDAWVRHPAATTFVGCGITASCPFSYVATWQGAGRWNIEVSTVKGRYKLCPLEELQFCEKNQFGWTTFDLPDDDDERFKPGLFKMTKAMLEQNGDMSDLPTIDDQLTMCTIVDHICGYIEGQSCGHGCDHDH